MPYVAEFHALSPATQMEIGIKILSRTTLPDATYSTSPPHNDLGERWTLLQVTRLVPTSSKLVYRLHRPVIRHRNISVVALWHSGGDRPCVLICGDEIDRFGHRLLSRLNIRCRVALKGRWTLYSQSSEATDKSGLVQHVLRMPGIVHVPHKKSWFTFWNESAERLSNPRELLHSG
jgi:hypothetical protein